MNCDQVFQYLTSTKPHDWNGELDRHVAGCESCRAMADLFRPAVALFGDRPGDDSAADAPRPWERVWEAVAVAERAAEQLRFHSAVATPRRPGPAVPLMRSAALVIAGVLVGGLLARVGAFGGQSSAANQVASPSADRFVKNVAGVRCENLMVHIRDATASGVCPTCEKPIEGAKARMLALCVACHRDQSESRHEPAARGQSWSRPRGLDIDSAGLRGPFSLLDPARQASSPHQPAAI